MTQTDNVTRPQNTRTDLSSASLILGIIGMVVGAFSLGVLPLLAVVFGHLGLRADPASSPARSGVILGYIGLAICVAVGLMQIVGS